MACPGTCRGMPLRSRVVACPYGRRAWRAAHATPRGTAILAVTGTRAGRPCYVSARGRDPDGSGQAAHATAGKIPARCFAGCPHYFARAVRATTCGLSTTGRLSTNRATHTPPFRLSVVPCEKMRLFTPTVRKGCRPTHREPWRRDSLSFVSGQNVVLQGGGGL